MAFDIGNQQYADFTLIKQRPLSTLVKSTIERAIGTLNEAMVICHLPPSLLYKKKKGGVGLYMKLAAVKWMARSIILLLHV